MPHETDGIWREWGAAVRQRRNALHLTQFQLAAKAGVAISTISDIERGVAGGAEQTKFDIARHLGCEVADLFAYPSTKQPTKAAS